MFRWSVLLNTLPFMLLRRQQEKMVADIVFEHTIPNLKQNFARNAEFVCDCNG